MGRLNGLMYGDRVLISQWPTCLCTEQDWWSKWLLILIRVIWIGCVGYTAKRTSWVVYTVSKDKGGEHTFEFLGLKQTLLIQIGCRTNIKVWAEFCISQVNVNSKLSMLNTFTFTWLTQLMKKLSALGGTSLHAFRAKPPAITRHAACGLVLFPLPHPPPSPSLYLKHCIKDGPIIVVENGIHGN